MACTPSTLAIALVPGDDLLIGPLASAVNAVAQALAALPVRGMLIGGIAVVARGVPRLTRDVDVTIEGERLDVARLIEQLRVHELAPRIDDAVTFATANDVLLLRHIPSGVDVDLSFASLPFELEALAFAEVLQIADVMVPVARAEDLIIYKAIAFRPQDQQDIERLVTLHLPALNMSRIRDVVRKLAAALDEPERLDALERILHRVGSLRGEAD